MNREDWVIVLFGPGQIVESGHPDRPLTFEQAEAMLLAYIASVQRAERGLQS
jgi:hypothetical protein